MKDRSVFIWAMIVIAGIALAIFLSSCTRKTLIVYDSKVFKEQFLRTDEFREGQIRRLENKFLNADYTVEYYGVYMVISPEMIEAKKGNRYILKRKFTKKLYNTF